MQAYQGHRELGLFACTRGSITAIVYVNIFNQMVVFLCSQYLLRDRQCALSFISFNQPNLPKRLQQMGVRSTVHRIYSMVSQKQTLILLSRMPAPPLGVMTP